MRKAMALSAMLFILAGAGRGQTMSYPINVSNSIHDSRWAQCAFGPDSVLHIIWQEAYIGRSGSDILYVSYDGKAFSTPFKLKDSPDVHAERPNIAVNSKGVIAAVWDSQKDIWCRIFDPVSRTWLPAERVSSDWEDRADEPSVAVDSFGNVYVFYYTGDAWVRSRINGFWDSSYRLNHPGARSQHGYIAAAANDTIWVMWIEKGDDDNYKTWYSRRTKDTAWRALADVNAAAGQSQAVPHFAFGKDNMPRVVWMHEFQRSVGAHWEIEIVMCTVDERVNPTEVITPSGLMHFPRIAMDSDDRPHVAIQDGPGDWGSGILYTTKRGGAWSTLYNFPKSFGFPKLPGISADGFGNVAVIWAAHDTTPQQEVWLSTLYPITPKNYLPPTNARANISLQGLRSRPQVRYDLSWDRNPENADAFLSGYDIYVKTGSGSWTLLQTVSNSTFTLTLTYADVSVKRKFGIRTRSMSGALSDLVEF